MTFKSSHQPPSADYKLEGDLLTFTVKSEEGATSYVVTVEPAPGGRRGGKGRKDKLGVDFYFTCKCYSYAKNAICKHIGCVCIFHFN